MSASIESKRPLFISYRRSDDEPPPKSRATGSISYFVDQLRYKLNDFGVSADRLWIDRNKLEPADEFTAVIKEQLEKTDILVAITSHGYASSGWCWEEVEYFANRLSAFPDHDRRRRIFRVDRHEVDNAELPKPLTGVQAVHLYKHDREAGHGREYYSRGKLTHKALYYDAIDKLAASIAKRIRELGLKKAAAYFAKELTWSSALWQNTEGSGRCVGFARRSVFRAAAFMPGFAGRPAPGLSPMGH